MTKISDSYSSKLSPEIFERSTARVYRKRSPLFRIKLRIFCSLHRPVGCYSRVYHYFITGLILYSCVIVNIFDTFFASYAVESMAVIDFILTGILTGELIIRLWSSDCNSDFIGFKGKFLYLKRYCVIRALDLIGIFTFSTFIYHQTFDGPFAILLRLLHVVQVFQIYRLLLPLLKLMISTIMVQFNQLYIAFIFASIIFVLMSFSIFLKEMDKFSIFESFWFTFITLTTIGYGDKVPQTNWGKILTVCMAFFGICAFQLPANIFGTGLAIKLKDEQKKILFQNPAANLIQTFWRCYSTDKESKQLCVWRLYKKSGSITELDKQCIRFVLKFRYFRARRQFKIMTDPKKFGDNSELQLDLLRKVSLIENSLTDLKDKTHELRIEYDSVCTQLEQLLHSLESE